MLDYSIHYRKWHDGSRAQFDSWVTFYRRLLGAALAQTPHDARILDIGCGQGLLLYALERFGYKNVEGIDLSEQQVAVGRKFGLNCRTVEKNYLGQRAKEAPGSLDLIFMMDVLEHVTSSEQLEMLGAASDLLAPGGRLILSVPNANASFGLRWRHIDWTHETSFTEHSLEFVLLNSRFVDVKFLEYEFIPRPRLVFIPRKSVFIWTIQRVFRFLRRLEAVGEMGEEGWQVPLALNLLAECTKVDAKL